MYGMSRIYGFPSPYYVGIATAYFSFNFYNDIADYADSFGMKRAVGRQKKNF